MVRRQEAADCEDMPMEEAMEAAADGIQEPRNFHGTPMAFRWRQEDAEATGQTQAEEGPFVLRVVGFCTCIYIYIERER